LEIKNLGIPVFQGGCTEIYREKAFTMNGLGPASPLPAAKMLGETSLMFQVHPTLSGEALDAVVNAVTTVMAAATA
jgi:dTDP-4-amino-4,6-dideoxygalactose transaminase